MFKIRKSSERGHANHGWLDTYHTFSFGSYHDKAHMGFADLRVINDDIIDAAKGFGTHPHNNMEIITFVLEGELEHKDSMGNGGVIKPYDVQRMSAGTGITHSEFNPSNDNQARVLQIWILPEKMEIQPSYEQKHFSKQDREGMLLVASKDGREGSVTINQDANVYASYLNGECDFGPAKNNVYIQVHAGELEINGHILQDGDGVAVTDEGDFKLLGKDAEFLLFEMN